MAYPERFVLDRGSSARRTGSARRRPAATTPSIWRCREERIELKAGAVIWATGWRPYGRREAPSPYGYGRIPNVITSVELERMMDPLGPTRGRLVRPSDGRGSEGCRVHPVRRLAGPQPPAALLADLLHGLAQSRARTTREQYGDEGRATIYYIDIRAIDRFEDFYRKVQEDPRVRFVKSKVASITADHGSGNPVLHGVDTEGYRRYANAHDLVVLAIGMQPSVDRDAFPFPVVVNRDGFIEPDRGERRQSSLAGCASDALDVNRSVQSATAAALRAIQVVYRAGAAEAG